MATLQAAHLLDTHSDEMTKYNSNGYMIVQVYFIIPFASPDISWMYWCLIWETVIEILSNILTDPLLCTL